MSKRHASKAPRNKQLARQKAARAARRAEVSPLYHLRPPFEPYREWLTAPAGADGLTITPEQEELLGDDAVEFMRRVVEIAPLYNGVVPMAAVYLDMQMSRGEITLAVTGAPDRVTVMKVADLAASMSDPARLDELRRAVPEAGLDAAAVEPLTVDECVAKTHELHRHGALVLDDNHVVHLAVPPKSPGGKWLLNGHATA